MLKTALAWCRHAMFARPAFLGARATLIRNGWRQEFRRLELGCGVLRGDQWQRRRTGRLIDDDFAHGFAATVIEHRPQG